MATTPSWEEAPDAWDLTLAGILLPGSCRVKIKPLRRIDRKQASGSKGAAIVDKGPGLAKVEIHWTFVADDWRAAAQACAKIFPGGGKVTPTPLDIVHPIASAFGVRSIFIEDIEAEDPDELGVCKWTISAYEYAKPRADKVTTLDKSKDAAVGPDQYKLAAGGTGDTAKDVYDAVARNRAARGLPRPQAPPDAAPKRRTAPSQDPSYSAARPGGR